MGGASADEVLPADDTEITVSVGWCGGMGEAVLAPPEFTGIQIFKDLPVFVTDTRIHDYIRNNAGGPIPSDGTAPCIPPRVIIKGRIRLVRKTDRNCSIRGAPLQTFWDARIERLDEIHFRDG